MKTKDSKKVVDVFGYSLIQYDIFKKSIGICLFVNIDTKPDTIESYFKIVRENDKYHNTVVLSITGDFRDMTEYHIRKHLMEILK